MGYLQLGGGIADFSKAVISFWFRIPAATLAAAQAQFTATWQADHNFNPNLVGKVPLLIFGDPGSATNALGTFNLGSCFIGVNCGHYSSSDEDNIVTSPHLVANLQYSSNNAVGLTVDTGTSDDYFAIGYQPDKGGSAATSSLTPLHIAVTADAWHHVLIAFDMSNGCATAAAHSQNFTDACKFYLAFDDTNYDGAYLWPAYTGCYSGTTPDTPNDIGSSWCLYTTNGITGDPQAQSFAAGNLPSNGHPLGSPGVLADVSHIYQVEMAELQIFCRVSLDTSVVNNRRAFITSDGSPANMSLAETLLGQAPDIKLHGSNNWKTGANTGSLGTTFTPTGNITTYSTSPDITP